MAGGVGRLPRASAERIRCRHLLRGVGAAPQRGDAGPECAQPVRRDAPPALVAAFSAFTLAGNKALASAHSATSAERWPAAESRARRAISLQPWSADPWRALGEAELEQGKLLAARKSLRSGIAKNPHDWRLWLDLALESKAT